MGVRRTDTPYISPYKCGAHNMWMRKGECELCRLERELKQREYEKTGGRNSPPVVIRKI